MSGGSCTGETDGPPKDRTEVGRPAEGTVKLVEVVERGRVFEESKLGTEDRMDIVSLNWPRA
jgi:hypothetical protein